MPHMRGNEFLYYLKGNELFKHIPVVMLSSEESTVERIQLLEAGSGRLHTQAIQPVGTQGTHQEINLKKRTEKEDMLYYIYIGNSQTAMTHSSKVTNGMFVTVSGARKAAKIIDGIRERYNTSILYEQTDTEKDCLDITCLHKRFPRVYIILITEGLPAEARKAYLQAGVNNTLPPQADETSIHRMTQFLQVRQKHKMQEFSQSHRKMLNTFHLLAWKRAFDILFAICALIILSPLLIGTAIAIRLESKGKVIYKSQRVGSNYRIFNFLKFRSMYTNADKKLKELNALNQYKMEEEAADDTPDIRFDDLTGSSDEEANLLISDDFIIPEKEFFPAKGPIQRKPVCRDRKRSARHTHRPFHP